MSTFDPEFAEMRFGCGLSPAIEPVQSIDEMLGGITAADAIAQEFPIETFDTFRRRMVKIAEYRTKRNRNRGTILETNATKQIKLLERTTRKDMAMWLGQNLLRRTHSTSGFFERLAFFWGDHFTAQGKRGLARYATAPYIEEAIRPNLTLRFADLLKAAVMHPLMLLYLDQAAAIGPNSENAKKKKQVGKGLNENLAREVLELHTLGVDSPYTQDDVRQLAELFTGLTFQVRSGFKFRRDFIEPGAETILGVTYSRLPNVKPILSVLEDLSVHPSTARHIATKLAVHFVSDTPDEWLIAHMTEAFIKTDGQLMAVYTAMLEHPSAWQRDAMNIKLPIDFVGSTCRALAVTPERINALSEKKMRNVIVQPMVLMGQDWQKAGGPDGWPEEDNEWITPQGVSGRVRWAMSAPEILQPKLPDPRTFVDTSLGKFASSSARFAAGAAESKNEAIGLVLSSPEFQRR